MAKIVVEGTVGLEVRYFLTRFVRAHGNCFIRNFLYHTSEITSIISNFQFQ